MERFGPDLRDAATFFAAFEGVCFAASRKVRARELHGGGAAGRACGVVAVACVPCREMHASVMARVFGKVRHQIETATNPPGLVRTVAENVSWDLAREARTAHGGHSRPERLPSKIAARLARHEARLLTEMLRHAGGSTRPEADPWPLDYWHRTAWAAEAGWDRRGLEEAVARVHAVCRTANEGWTVRFLDDQLTRRRIELGPRLGQLSPTAPADEDYRDAQLVLNRAADLRARGRTAEEAVAGAVLEVFGSAAAAEVRRSDHYPEICDWVEARQRGTGGP